MRPRKQAPGSPTQEYGHDETSLAQHEERYRLLVDSVQDYALILLDREGIVVSWNAGAQRIKGYSADEIIGRSFSVFYPEEAIEAGWPRAVLQQTRAEGRFKDEDWRVRKDGSRFWGDIVITAVYDDEGEHLGFAKVTRDLTERREQEERLRRSEEQLQLLLESVSDYAIFMLDTEGRVRSWNVGAAAIKGYRASEIIGRHFSVFYRAEDVARGKPSAVLERALRQGHVIDEGWRVRKDGTVFWADVTVTPVFDSSGSPRGFAKVTRDATKRRRLVELETSSRRMMEFLATLGHELRNPLTPIRNSVYLLKSRKQMDGPLERLLDILERQTYHLTRLVDDLLDVGRISSGKMELKFESIDLAELVRRTAETMSSELSAREQRLELDLPGVSVLVRGDETRLSQALQNLLTNASKFTPNGGLVTVEAQLEDRVVNVIVRDNGRGLSPSSIETIFELFVQENGGGGLGIGLSLARRLVELHGGSLYAASPGPGLGSSFTIRLPVAAPAPVAHDKAQRAIAPEGESRSRRVLVVDDNEDAANTFVELLGLLGHSARAAHDGHSALELAESFRPVVVFLDIHMPGEDGYSVIRRLRKLVNGEQLFVAALTGYGQREDRERTREAGFDVHLTKPVTVERLRDIFSALAPH